MSAVSTVINDAYKKIQAQQWPQSVVIVTQDNQVFQELSRQMVAKMVCKDTSEGAPCGKCSACRLWEEKSHPDILCIEPDGQSIKIDSVRAILAHTTPTPQGHCQVVVMREADKLTVQAANSLLKVLEEPKPGLFFLLQTKYWGALLPTIRSRAQRLMVPTEGKAQPNNPTAQTGWEQLLQDYGGQSVGAYEERRNDAAFKTLCGLLWTQWIVKGKPPLQLVDKLAEYRMEDVCDVMQTILYAHIGKKMGFDARAQRLYQSFVRVYGEAPMTISLWQNYQISQTVRAAAGLVRSNMAHTATYQLDRLVISTKLQVAGKSR